MKRSFYIFSGYEFEDYGVDSFHKELEALFNKVGEKDGRQKIGK